MESLRAWLLRWSPLMLSILRIMAAGMFLLHGAQTLYGWPPGGHGIALAWSLGWVGGVMELVGGALLLLGLLTRQVAFLLSGEMAVGYFMAHAPRAFYPVTNGGELAVLYCFLFLYFVFSGGGSISLDNLLAKRRTK